MKIEKIDIDENEIPTIQTIKINKMIELMTCSQCGNIKGVVGEGLCFTCYRKESKK